MEVRPGNRVNAMNRLRRAIEDANESFGTILLIAESSNGGKSVAYFLQCGRDGGSELSAYTMLQTVPPEWMDAIYPPREEPDEQEDEHVEDDDEDEAGA